MVMLPDLLMLSFQKQNKGEQVALFNNQPYNVDLTESYWNNIHAVTSSSGQEPCIPAFLIHCHKWVIGIINILPSWKECPSTLQLQEHVVQRCLFFHRHSMAT